LKKKKTYLAFLTDIFLFCAPKTHFCIGRHENKEKCRFYFGLRILLPMQIQLLEIENPKNPKIDSPCSPN
jgi:hypothetical protein